MKNILYFILLYSVFSFSQTKNTKEFSAQKITYKDGVSLGYVRDVVQDSTGMLWITGQDIGVHAFDGKNVKTFHRDSKSNPFPLDQTLHMQELKNGNFLICNWSKTAYEYNVYSKKIIDSIPFKKLDDISNMYDFVVDKNQVIWAVSFPFNFGDYTWLLKSENNKPFERVSKIPVKTYPQLIEYDDKIFVSGDSAIYSFAKDGTLVKRYPLYDNGLSIPIFGISTDENNNLWVKSDGKAEEINKSNALFKLNKQTDEFEIFELKDKAPLINSEFIRVIDNNLWIGGVHENLWKVNLETLEAENYTEELRKTTDKTFYILGVFKDKTNQLWVTTSRGLIKLNRNEQKRYSRNLTLSSEFCEDNCYIQSIAHTKTHIYYSYLFDLIAYNKQTKTFKKIDNVSLDPKNVKIGTTKEIYWDEGSNKLSTYKDQIIWHDELIDSKTFSKKDLLPNHSDFRVSNVLDNDNLWLIPYYPNKKDDQVYIYNLKTNKLKNVSPGIELRTHDFPLGVWVSKTKDRVYVAYQLSGFVEFDKKGNLINHVNDTFFSSVYETEDGSVWFGTPDGIVKYENKKLIHYKNNYFHSQGKKVAVQTKSMIQVDNNLLIGSDEGLHVFDLKTEQFTKNNFPIEFKNIEFTYAANYYDKANKLLYLGTKNGVLELNTETINDTERYESPYQIAISEYSIYNNKKNTETKYNTNLSELKKITLTHNDLWLKFDYFLPNYINSENILYSSYLEGFDNKWSQPSTNNQTQFSNLPPGNYTLKIKAGYNPIDLKNTIVPIQITVKQAWYKTWWFIGFCILSIISLVAGALNFRYRKKLEKQLAVDNLRVKISSDLHDDVGSILTGLSMQTELLEHQSKGENKAKLSRISELSKSAMLRMRDAVWAMDSRKDNWRSLLDRMNEFAAETLELKGISYQIKYNSIALNKDLDNLFRQNLYLIYKEAITNILKHSDANNVQINIQENNGKPEMTIRDNGNVELKFSSSGLGLSNMKERAQQINSQIIIKKDNGFVIQLKAT